MLNTIENIKKLNQPEFIGSREKGSQDIEFGKTIDIAVNQKSSPISKKQSYIEQETLRLQNQSEITDKKIGIVKEMSRILENPKSKETGKELNMLFKNLRFYEMAEYLNIGSEILKENEAVLFN